MVESPCTSDCCVEEGICVGCGRTLDEIRNWSKLSDKQKADVIQRLNS